MCAVYSLCYVESIDICIYMYMEMVFVSNSSHSQKQNNDNKFPGFIFLVVLDQKIWVFPKKWYPQIIHLFIGFSIINHSFWGTPMFGNIHMETS